MQDEAKTARIRALNDVLRVTGQGGRVMATAALNARGPEFLARVIAAVRAFSDFTAVNDPYGEHDCATLDVDGERVRWKIDYYDADYEFGSEDPADPEQTKRVLTIGFPSDF